MASVRQAGPAAPCDELALAEREFQWFRDAMRRHAGIELGPQKKSMVASRLSSRLRQLGLGSYPAYIAQLSADQAELQAMVDLLTTNETYFFREPRQFDFIDAQLDRLSPRGQPLRAWSAASSSGEEAYSLAMLLAERRGLQGWEILASDISRRVLARAQRGLYPLERTRNIPPEYLRSYCLKGVGPQQGRVLVDRCLRERVSFHAVNLNEALPEIGRFRLVLLRNVLIYFDKVTKAQVVERVVERLEPGGVLIIGQAETLHGVSSELAMMQPSVYRKC